MFISRRNGKSFVAGLVLPGIAVNERVRYLFVRAPQGLNLLISALSKAEDQ